jgi:predicted RNA-binding protein
MCLAKIYLGESDEELLVEEIALLEVKDNVLRLSTIFGEEREIEGVIKAIDFQTGSVHIERRSGSLTG